MAKAVSLPKAALCWRHFVHEVLPFQLMEKFNQKRTAEFEALREQTKQARGEVRAKYPFKSWKEYLQYLAGQGNETALAALRSKEQEKSTGKYVSQSPATHSMGKTSGKSEPEKSFGR